MRVAVSGSTGLVGSALVWALLDGGHSVTRVVRAGSELGEGSVRWDPVGGSVDAVGLEGHDAVVNLAGENLGGGRWDEEKKARIRDSRVLGTRLLAETLTGLSDPPEVLVCASAVGFYGDRGEEVLTEQSPTGSGFLARVSRELEEATGAAEEAGMRVVRLRFGIVLSPWGGALGETLGPFKLGLGGPIGGGRQWWSWVALDDVVGAILFALTDERMSGPANVTSPNPVRHREFARTLGKVLRRPAVLPVPAFAIRAALGEMADELLLASARVQPARLLGEGYGFGYPELEGALRHLLDNAATGIG